MSAATPVILGDDPLTVTTVDEVASHGAPVHLSPAARQRLDRSHAALQEMVARGVPIYGLTTGCGPLAGASIAPEQRSAFQRNLIRSHATGIGAPHSTAHVRAAMLVRAQVFAAGGSGVDPVLADVLLGMLNAGIHPVVPEIGGVGASGDLVELAHIALAVLGEGDVEYDGSRAGAADALRAAGLSPFQPQLREGLALINGTSFHTGTAAVLAARTARIFAAAEAAAAMAVDALGGHPEAFDPALQVARPFAGQGAVAARLLAQLAGSRLVRDDDCAGSQDPYTLRCIPQVRGAAVDSVEAARRVIEIELNAVSDNPLLLADEQRAVHGGNFHGQPVAMALDQLKTALISVGVIAERRLARLLDAQRNRGLPPFLARNGAGLSSGFMGLQYCATTLAAENAQLSAPASVRSIPTNADNQDMVSMAMLAARQAARVAGNVAQLIAIELLCCAQALELRGLESAGKGTRASHTLVRRHARPVDADRPLSSDVEAVCALVEGGAFELPPTTARAQR